MIKKMEIQMEKFTKNSIVKILGESSVNAFITSLRKEGLGDEVMVNVDIRGIRTIKPGLVFDTEKCITKFQDKIYKYQNNPFSQPSKIVLESYQRTLKRLMKIKSVA